MALSSHSFVSEREDDWLLSAVEMTVSKFSTFLFLSSPHLSTLASFPHLARKETKKGRDKSNAKKQVSYLVVSFHSWNNQLIVTRISGHLRILALDLGHLIIPFYAFFLIGLLWLMVASNSR